MEHANTAVRLFVPLFSIIIVTMILTARRRSLFIRRIQGLTAIDEAVGRATEMGRPMLCCSGLGKTGGTDIDTLQALSIISYIIRSSAKFATRAIVPVYQPTTYPIAVEIVQDAYAKEGRSDLFNASDVRFLSNQQFAFAAAVSGIIWREKVAASFLFGYFYAESLIFAETGQQAGAIQVAGTPTTTQIPFFIAACDYVIIGDEFYAASAYLSREPTLLGSLVGQDICKGIVIVIVLIGCAVASLAPTFAPQFINFFTK